MYLLMLCPSMLRATEHEQGKTAATASRANATKASMEMYGWVEATTKDRSKTFVLFPSVISGVDGSSRSFSNTRAFPGTTRTRAVYHFIHYRVLERLKRHKWM